MQRREGAKTRKGKLKHYPNLRRLPQFDGYSTNFRIERAARELIAKRRGSSLLLIPALCLCDLALVHPIKRKPEGSRQKAVAGARRLTDEQSSFLFALRLIQTQNLFLKIDPHLK